MNRAGAFLIIFFTVGNTAALNMSEIPTLEHSFNASYGHLWQRNSTCPGVIVVLILLGPARTLPIYST